MQREKDACNCLRRMEFSKVLLQVRIAITESIQAVFLRLIMHLTAEHSSAYAKVALCMVLLSFRE